MFFCRDRQPLKITDGVIAEVANSTTDKTWQSINLYWPDTREFLLDRVKRVLPWCKRMGGCHTMQGMCNLIIFDGNHSFGVYAQERITTNVFATLNTFEQERS